MDGNGLKSNCQSVHFGDCVVSVSKIISKKSRLDYYSGQKNIIKKKIAGSIIGPAMAGPTGLFATALTTAMLPMGKEFVEVYHCNVADGDAVDKGICRGIPLQCCRSMGKEFVEVYHCNVAYGDAVDKGIC